MSSNNLICIVSGPRQGIENGARIIKDTLEELRLSHKNMIIIHGDASGIDTQAKNIANNMGISTIGMPSNWKKYGKSGGPIRNIEMLQLLTHYPKKEDWKKMVIAFGVKESKGGTKHIVSIARKVKGLEIREIE